MTVNKSAGEFDFIKNLSSVCETGDKRVICGVGDDCAVYKDSGDGWEIVTTDAMVEGVHFSFDYFSPEKLGAKLASINLSDIAAMGGEPRFAVVSVSSPPKTTIEILLKIYEGLTSVLNNSGVEIVGGNTTASLSGLSLHMTVMGQVNKERALFRSGARPGDAIFVTGNLGDSAAGLEVLQCGSGDTECSWVEAGLIEKHLSPVARLEEGRILSESSLVSAMMDISDGLSSDITRICERSQVGAIIHEELLPLSRELCSYKKGGREGALAFALHGGEDYELLFTAPQSVVEKVFSLADRENIKITQVGSITEERCLRQKKRGGEESALEAEGYDHFVNRPRVL